ncbi:MAG: ROK family protein [Streptococcaceae bacterium]|nr:ROK family protein [Streptococcaceae bacterium]
MEKLIASIEAGGTKFVVAVADNNFQVIKQVQISTTTPEKTLEEVIAFLKQFEIQAIGVGSFGPIDIDKRSKTYGYITTTPKIGWANFDFLGMLKAAFDVPIAWTTDVNASAYGEYLQEAVNSLVYFTIGTGIGGGAIQNGEFIGGVTHAEMGHACVMPHPDDIDFAGSCPFHGKNCLEGVAAGPSIEARVGVAGERLPRTHEVFDLIAYYVAQAAYNSYVTLAPERIIFGGSVLQEEDMIKVRQYFTKFNNGYVTTPDLEKLIQRPRIENNGSATIGNFALALNELKK